MWGQVKMEATIDFGGDFGLWQRKVAECLEGTERRMSAFNALAVQSGQAVLDIGCGGGHLVRALALAVGENGRAVGLDVNVEQLETARDLCAGLPAAELSEGNATNMAFEDGTFDSLAAIQSLEYIPEVDKALAECRRVLKPGGKAALISVIWDHWRFYGADSELTDRILDAWRAHCVYQTLPMDLPYKLAAAGFGGIFNQPIAFMNSSMHENAYALWASKIAAAFAVGQGIPEEDAQQWQEQLGRADAEGRFAFVSVPVLTTAIAI